MASIGGVLSSVLADVCFSVTPNSQNCNRQSMLNPCYLASLVVVIFSCPLPVFLKWLLPTAHHVALSKLVIYFCGFLADVDVNKNSEILFRTWLSRVPL